MALVSSPEQPRPLREVAWAVKGWVERLGAVWVSGQLIALNRRTGPTHFLTLRDSHAEVSVAVTAATAVLDAAGPVNEGMEVVALIKPAVWLASGRLSFECHDLRPVGVGRLLAEIEQRKRRLFAEGLFDPARKRPIPVLPRRIGLVTAPGSAAERDVVVNIAQRWPAALLEVRHCLMQGPHCAAQVSQAVYELDAKLDVDVIIVARGGGSVEDLLPFSDEGLARVVAAAATPVVSAIGHESDTPILDLVADLRASTPTDAAKRVVPDAASELGHVTSARHQMRRALLNRIDGLTRDVAALRSRPVMRDPLGGYAVLDLQIALARERLDVAVGHRLDRWDLEVAHLIAQVRTMSPKATLDRGYSILLADAETAITDPAQVRPGQSLTAFLKAGTLNLFVAQPKPEDDHARQDSARQDSARREGARGDDARREGARGDDARPDDARGDNARPDDARPDGPRGDDASGDEARGDGRPDGAQEAGGSDGPQLRKGAGRPRRSRATAGKRASKPD
ncbi:MAG: exodeoxyribonuclease VII large subunit [Propionibacteriaceae bacterium]|jgi:exodeoxyribonuclease VII large subunit|nr:exodeoxyribonuclease VII large subunit [Propionibacteriaceae bacterium]